MSKLSLSTLRSRATILVLLAIFPLLALTFYSYFDQRDRAIREVQRDELIVARNLATIQETLINKTRQLLMTLTQLPQVQRRDSDACNAIFAALLEQSPHSASIGAADSAGRLFASAPAAPGAVNYADRPWFQKIIQTRDFVIGETVLGRISGKYGNILAYPILDGEGRFLGALSTQMNLDWLGDLLAQSQFPPTTAMVLTDSTYKVLFRYPDPGKYVGEMLPDSLVKAMTSSDEGVAAGVGLPGDVSLFSFIRLSPPWQEMRLIISLPRDWAVGPVNRALWHNLIWLGLGALFAMAAARYGGNLFVVGPVKKLRTVTERLAAGDLTVRSGSDYTRGELGLLAHSFDKMADSLQEREETLREREAKYRAAIETSGDGFCISDMAGRFLEFNDAYVNLTGYSREELLNMSAPDIEAQRTAAEIAAVIEKVRCEGHANFETKHRSKDGRVWPAEVHLSYWPIAGGRIFVFLRNITERKQAEKKLRESEQNLRYLASQLLTAQEQEKHKISLELHDTVAQELAALKIDLENLQLNWPEKPVEEFNQRISHLLQKLQQTLSLTRTLSYNLRPPELEHLGLVQAIKLHCGEFTARTGIKVDFKAAGIEVANLDYEAAINLYRIIQEGLTNVWRHAQADNVNIRLVSSFPKIILRLEDNGQGFNVAEQVASNQPNRHMGLLGMKERVSLLGGEMKIDSQSEKGTRISIEIPWKDEDHGSNEETLHR